MDPFGPPRGGGGVDASPNESALCACILLVDTLCFIDYSVFVDRDPQGERAEMMRVEILTTCWESRRPNKQMA